MPTFMLSALGFSRNFRLYLLVYFLFFGRCISPYTFQPLFLTSASDLVFPRIYLAKPQHSASGVSSRKVIFTQYPFLRPLASVISLSFLFSIFDFQLRNFPEYIGILANTPSINLRPRGIHGTLFTR